MRKTLLNLVVAAGLISLGAGSVQAESKSRLEVVKERGSLLCSGHNGSFLGFAEVDDKGKWKGVDIDLCRALAAGVFGKSEGNLQIVPVSWAQRWPSLQSGDIDVVIKVSGWTQSRDTELNLAFSRPYFMGAFQIMAKKNLEAKSVADLDGGSICAPAGTSTERKLAAYLENKNIDAEIIAFEKGDESRSAYFSDRCDGLIEWGPSLAAMRVDAEKPADHVIFPDILGMEGDSIIVPEGDPDWLDVQNWMLSSLWFAELNGITSANVDQFKAKPPTTEIGKLLGVTPGYGERLGLSDDWAYNMIKEVGNFGEIYDRNIGVDSPYKLPRGINSLYTEGGVFFPMTID